jgi:ADP-heptose:LPS heptosyltransferase
MRERAVQYAIHKVLGARVLERIGTLAIPLVQKQSHIPQDSFLLIEPFGLGDLVAATALLGVLRDQFPNARIGVACHERWADWVGSLPFVDRVHGYRFPWSTTPKRLGLSELRSLVTYVGALRRERYHTGIDIRGDVRSQLLLVSAGCVRRVGFSDYMGSNMRLSGSLLTHAAQCGVRPRMEELQSLLGHLDLPDITLRMRLVRAPAEKSNSPSKQVGIHLGAGWEFRKWPLVNWIKLLEGMAQKGDVEFTLLGSDADAKELHSLAEAVGDRARVLITPSVGELIGRIAQLDILVCHDSAPLHIAAALDVPAVGLFGPGELVRWAHPGTRMRVIHHREQFPCSPCTQIRCIHPDATCVGSISVNEVVVATEELLGRVNDVAYRSGRRVTGA